MVRFLILVLAAGILSFSQPKTEVRPIPPQPGNIDKIPLIGPFDDHTILDFLPTPVLSLRQTEDALARRVFERLIEPIGSSTRSSAVDTVPPELICRNL